MRNSENTGRFMGLSKNKALLGLLPVYIAIAILSTAVTANLFDWAIWMNGAFSGINGWIVCSCLYPFLTKPKKSV